MRSSGQPVCPVRFSRPGARRPRSSAHSNAAPASCCDPIEARSHVRQPLTRLANQSVPPPRSFEGPSHEASRFAVVFCGELRTAAVALATEQGERNERGRDRTDDPRIKSPLLYQLSYAPVFGEAASTECVRRSSSAIPKIVVAGDRSRPRLDLIYTRRSPAGRVAVTLGSFGTSRGALESAKIGSDAAQLPRRASCTVSSCSFIVRSRHANARPDS